jgi:putative Mg2+ transporter-C (MgtC) family protein
MLGNFQIIIRLIISAVLGGIIGFEREKHKQKMAGLRTHIIVCVGSALIMLVSIYMFEIYSAYRTVDPSRIAASVITGIGFLGAGTIIRSGGSVMGLTTAASIWTVSGIGLAVGCGFYMAGYVTTVIVFITLYLLRKLPIEDKKEEV